MEEETDNNLNFVNKFDTNIEKMIETKSAEKIIETKSE